MYKYPPQVYYKFKCEQLHTQKKLLAKKGKKCGVEKALK